MNTQNLTDKEQTAMEALLSQTEGDSSNGWSMVYLDNARPSGWDFGTWSGVLGSLAKKGLYRPVDGSGIGDMAAAWGEVKSA
jgi:hypothetical protein